MAYINQFINSNNKEKLWHKTDPLVKQVIIKQMFKNKTDAHIKLARELLEFIRMDTKLEKRDIHANYANLLCILLAKSHNPEFIKDIVETKRCLFFHIDSNLFFEFSPKHSRETCVRDTMDDVVNNLDNVNNTNHNKTWFPIYKEWVEYYGSHYDETLVIKYWNKYKEPNYCDHF